MTSTVRDALSGPVIKPLAATFGVQTMVSAAMFAVPVIAPLAALSLGVDPALIGTYMAIAYTFGTVAGLFTGTLVRRYGPIRICQLTAVLAGLGAMALAGSSLPTAVLSAVLMGIAYGPVNPVTATLLASVSTPRWRAFVLSAKQTGMPVGGALVGAAMPVIALAHSWQAAMVSVGIAAIVVAACIQPLRSEHDGERDPATPLKLQGFMAPLQLLREQAAVRRLALVGFAYSGTQVSLASYYVIFLTEQLGTSLTAAGLAFTIMQASAVGGRLVWGWMADGWIRGGHLLAAIGLGSGAVSLWVAHIGSSGSFLFLALLSAVLGITTHGWNGVFFSQVTKATDSERTAEATGAVQFTSLAGVASVPPAFAGLTLLGGYGIAFTGMAILVCAAGLWSLRR